MVFRVSQSHRLHKLRTQNTTRQELRATTFQRPASLREMDVSRSDKKRSNIGFSDTELSCCWKELLLPVSMIVRAVQVGTSYPGEAWLRVWVDATVLAPRGCVLSRTAALVSILH